MYNIVLSENVLNKLEQFLIYKSYNCIYKDSGIFNEKLIISNYISNNEKFLEELKIEINLSLRDGLGGIVIEYENLKFKKVLKVRSYVIILKYNISKEENKIYVNDILITL